MRMARSIAHPGMEAAKAHFFSCGAGLCVILDENWE